MKLSDLTPNPRNPRKISDEKLAMLKKSVDEFGDISGICFNDATGNLFGGHQRLKVLPPDADIVITQVYDPPSRTGTTKEGHVVIAGEKFKYREVDWPAEKELAAMVSANKQGGEWEFPILNDLLLELDDQNFDIELLGYDDKELEKQLINVSGYDREPPGEKEDEESTEAEKEVVRIQHIKIPQVVNGDCLEVLKTFESDKFDSLVTDPPAGISFMGKEWDDDKGGSKQWISWLSDVMKETLRVLKPGAHGLVWAIPRTSHWTATALEDAGFDIRDVVTHLFGSGFPKSLDVSKAIDKMNGDSRPVVVKRKESVPDFSDQQFKDQGSMMHTNNKAPRKEINITSAASAASAAWEGWGTSLKPASEHWILVRKPLGEKTVAQNVLKHGVGGINIEASRIGSAGGTARASQEKTKTDTGWTTGHEILKINGGRFPANLVLSHNVDCEMVSGGSRGGSLGGSSKGGFQDEYVGGKAKNELGMMNYDDETPEKWLCTEGCPVAILDTQGGVSKPKPERKGIKGGSPIHQSSLSVEVEGTLPADPGGGASRFFYCSKPSKRERNDGCDALVAPVGTDGSDGFNAPHVKNTPLAKNHHPTVKPIKLMTYFIKMVTPEGGTVLDPFCGSGTTGVAAGRNGFEFLGIEQNPEYANIASHRFQHEMKLSDAELEDIEGAEPEPA